MFKKFINIIKTLVGNYLGTATLLISFFSIVDVKAEEIAEVTLEKLSQDPQWLSLIHYKVKSENEVESFADTASFFFAQDGKENALSELQTTKDRFLDPADKSYCQYPARYKWLSKYFTFPHSLTECSELNTWISAIHPMSITLVFADSFLNNPASLFGHTFLKINSERGAPLLDYVVQYTAKVENDPGPIYAAKGVFGIYSGYFNIAPYYDSVSKYNDYEQRDLWEYNLDLTTAEIEMMLLHIWELRSIGFDYYYFDENCSFHLLSLLSVARPSLKLNDQLLPWIIPSDTLKSLLTNDGILKSVNYRPSRSTKLKARAKELTGEQKRVVIDLAKSKINLDDERYKTLSDIDKAKVLETANEYTEYLGNRGAAAENIFSILKERSKLPVREKPFAVDPPDTEPDKTHGSRKFFTERGYHTRRGLFLAADLRPAYHGLLDPSKGFIDGAEIEVFDTKLRFVQSFGVELEKFTLAKVISLTPDTDFIKKFSWELSLGVGESVLTDEGRTAIADVGIGKSYLLTENNKLYSFARVRSDTGGGASDIAPGFTVGILSELYDDVRSNLKFDIYPYKETQKNIEFSVTYPVLDSNIISLRFLKEEPFGENGSLIMWGWGWFF